MKTKRKAVVIDLDGTLCNTDHRQHHVDGRDYQKKDFIKFYEKMSDDTPHEWCVNLLHLYRQAHYAILFVSGRPEEYREKTEEWISRHVALPVSAYQLWMRPTDDYTDDRDIKEGIYRKHIEPYYDVEVVIDDRRKVVERWRQIGLTCLQCAPGDF